MALEFKDYRLVGIWDSLGLRAYELQRRSIFGTKQDLI